jgi:hypothetical protein
MQPPDVRPVVNEFGEIVRADRAGLPIIAVYDIWYPPSKEDALRQTLRELDVRLLARLKRKGKWYRTKRVSARLEATEDILKLMEQRLDEINVTARRD